MDHETKSREPIQERDDELRRLTMAVRQLELTSAHREVQLEALSSQVARMSESLEWKLASYAGPLVRGIAPVGSRRRAFLKTLSRSPRAIARRVKTAFHAPLAGRTEKRAAPQHLIGPALGPSASQHMCIVHPRHGGRESSRPISSGTIGDRVVGRILIIDHRLPSPDRDCGSLRMVEIIRVMLERGHPVTFIPDNFLVWSPYFEELCALGAEVVHPPEFETVADYLRVHGSSFDLALISRAGIAARHIGTVRWLAPKARVVFDTVDLHFVREERAAELAQDPELKIAAAHRREQELGLASRSDLTLVVSAVEKAILELECPGIEVMVIPTIYPVAPAPPAGFDDRHDVVFIGGFDHAPNVDAVMYFAREILPRIGDRLPGSVFKVIGADPPSEIRALAGPQIEILGHVPNVDPIFHHAFVSVAPLRFGAGVKGKINHSMALGVPVVATSLAAEGMHLEHEQSVMIADSPDDFAEAIVRVCRSRPLWERLSSNGRDSIRQHFSVEAAARSIDAMLEWADLQTHSQRSRRDASPVR